MTTIYIPVEVDENDLAGILGGAVAHSKADPTASQPLPPEDPWSGDARSSAATPQTAAPTPQGGYAGNTYSPGPGPGMPTSQQAQAPMCQHGPMRYVQAGVSQRTGKPYRAFWGCAASQNDPTKCKSLQA